MEKIALLVLWFLVVATGLLAGGSIFERVVVTPLWAGAPPTSVTAWTLGSIQRPFFMVVTPLWALTSLASIGVAFALPPPARPWARAAGAIGVATFIWTLAFFIPILEKTEVNRGVGLSSEEITRLVRLWVGWGMVRTTVVLGGWLAALRALTLASR